MKFTLCDTLSADNINDTHCQLAPDYETRKHNYGKTHSHGLMEPLNCNAEQPH